MDIGLAGVFGHGRSAPRLYVPPGTSGLPQACISHSETQKFQIASLTAEVHLNFWYSRPTYIPLAKDKVKD